MCTDSAFYFAVFLVIGVPLLLVGTLWLLVWIGFLPKPLLKARAGRCRHCGYDLTGNESGVCSECGAGISGHDASP